ncbi:MAG: CoA transferase [Betaproteobacteria bacterium]|nr:CoA transferase [Betaproteobacteria bacterium]
MSGPLHGVRIIDLTTVILGPYATQILADYGADVIKVEPPEGDNTRYINAQRNPGMGANFLHLNRNKRSIVLDLKKPQGREALLRLVKTADVLAYNVRPAAMARLKLAYEDVAAVNPRIIYAGATGFKQSGTYAAKAAYDDIIQGMVALPSLFVQAGADRPRFVPSTLTDRITGLNTVHAIIAALFHRERTGEGQSVEIPMFEGLTQFILSDHMGGKTFEPPIAPMGYPRLLTPHRNPYKTSDGYIGLLIYNDKQWRSFYKLIGKSEAEFEQDERVNTHINRGKHFDALYAWVASVMVTRTCAEWLEALAQADIPAAPLKSLDDLLDDAHHAATGFFKVREHPSEGAIREMDIPTTWSKSQPELRHFAPRLGEHSAEVLREAGYTDDEIQSLHIAGVTHARKI